MITIKVSDLPEKKNLVRIRKMIMNDGILLYPTDTLYGMGGNPFSPAVIKRMDALKGRRNLPYSIAVSGQGMLEEMTASLPEVYVSRLASLLPGKFTFLFAPSGRVPRALIKGSNKIGIRIPAYPSLLALIHFLEIPIISTSVNISGQPAHRCSSDVSEYAREISRQNIPCIFIDAGDLPPSDGSTIVDTVTDPVRVIRKGDDYQFLADLNIRLH